jgi:DNA invertase Pin-like site-specific DNA recombinase
MMNDNKEKHVAIYVRVAIYDQLAIEMQEAGLRQYADKQGYTDLLTYADNGQSGSSVDRPAFRQLITNIESGKVDKVITRDVGRISRNYTQMQGFMSILDKNDVKLDTLDGSHEFYKSTTEQALHMMKMKSRGNKARER